MRALAITVVAATGSLAVALAMPGASHAGVHRVAGQAHSTIHNPADTELVSAPAPGGSSDGISGRPSLDDAGDVVFTSAAHLSSNDSNSVEDVYLRTATGTTRLISRTSGGAAGNGASSEPAISRNGRFIVFASEATNIATSTPDGDGSMQVFRYDRDPSGNGLDGSDYSLTMVSLSKTGGVPDGVSDEPAVAGSSTPYIAFRSAADDIVGTDLNGAKDIFLSANGTSRLVSSGLSGDPSNGSSADPNLAVTTKDIYVGFDSIATNLTSGDINGYADVFLRTIPQGSGAATTTMVSFDGQGDSTNPSLSSAAGRIAYASTAAKSGHSAERLAYVASKPFGVGRSTNVAPQGAVTGNPVVSGDGGYVAFSATGKGTALNGLTATQTRYEVFLYRLSTKEYVGVSGSSTDTNANGGSAEPSLAGHGVQIAFASTASNLAAGDSDHTEDVFLRTRDSTGPPTPTLTKASYHWSRYGSFTVLAPDDNGTLRSGTIGLVMAFGRSKSKSGLVPDGSSFVAIKKDQPYSSKSYEVGCVKQPCGGFPDGAHYYLRVRAMDAEGNLSSYGILGPIKLDATGPHFTVNSVAPRGVASRTVKLTWAATDAGSGLAAGKKYSVVVDRTRAGGLFEEYFGHPYTVRTSKTSVSIRLSPGAEYDVSVWGRDKVGNLGSTLDNNLFEPVPVAKMRWPKGWTRSASPAYYDGVAQVTAQPGRSATIPENKQDFHLIFAATTCPTCGKIEIMPVNARGKKLDYFTDPVFNLHSSTTRHSVLMRHEFVPAPRCQPVADCREKPVAGYKIIDVGGPGQPVAIEGLITFRIPDGPE
jgi:hypothetical protein